MAFSIIRKPISRYAPVTAFVRWTGCSGKSLPRSYERSYVAAFVRRWCGCPAFFVAYFGVALPGSLPSAQASSALKAEETWGEARVVQLVEGNVLRRNYPDALTSLIAEINRSTTLRLHPDPLFIESFEDDALLEHSLVYVNFADRRDWTLSEREKSRLRQFILNGGFIFLDAGISASFLRENAQYGQSHSFAEWQVSPEVAELFQQVIPEERFQALPRSHPLFRAFYSGLPDPSSLPEAVRDYVVNEKWPQGTYSSMGLFVEGRLAIVALPIMAMGWGRNEMGQWTTFIGFRVREGAEGLSERLAEAAYSGVRFEVMREDGRQDWVYTQQEATPAWVQQPDETWRIFRYYFTPEISDYAHAFYTRLGVNVFIYAFTQ